MKLNKYYLGLAVAAGLFASSAAYAASTPVQANVAFAAAITLSNVTNIDFDTVVGGTTATYTIDTTGDVTTVGGAIVDETGAHEGSVTITGADGVSAQYYVGNYTANNTVTPSAATCNYNGGGAAACPTSTTPGTLTLVGAGADILLGVTISVPDTVLAGETASPTMDLVVNYI